MIQVVNGEIKQFSLPKTGVLKDGRAVSGYDLLDITILEEEGWLPLEDNPPLYDINTQYLEFSDYEILQDKVIKHYNIKNVEDTETDSAEVSLDSIQEDNGMLALMVSMLMVEVDMLKAQVGGI